MVTVCFHSAGGNITSVLLPLISAGVRSIYHIGPPHKDTWLILDSGEIKTNHLHLTLQWPGAKTGSKQVLVDADANSTLSYTPGLMNLLVFLMIFEIKMEIMEFS